MHALVDSHAHLDDDAFDADRAETLGRAAEAGVTSVVVPATDARSWRRIHELADTHPCIHPAYGLHPMFLTEDARTHVDELSSWLASHPAVAVGEIGLDFHVKDIDPALQRQVFARQLAIAREHDLPVIVHGRGAMEEVVLTLRRCGGVRGVVHSFSGSEQQARQLWDIGFHLGIGGPVTYERAQRLRRIVAGMPLAHLLLESDAPDQPDAMHRGRRNEPARVATVAACIAALRGESPAAIATATTANARRLFNLQPALP